jgi:hypothetical protein
VALRVYSTGFAGFSELKTENQKPKRKEKSWGERKREREREGGITVGGGRSGEQRINKTLYNSLKYK